MDKRVETVARQRIDESASDIRNAFEKIENGNPYAAEPDLARLQGRLQTKTSLVPESEAQIQDQIEAEQIRREIESQGDARAEAKAKGDGKRWGVSVAKSVRSDDPKDGRERIWGEGEEFVSVGFLERGACVARSVARVSSMNGRPRGTAVLIGEGLLLTNHHVIKNQNQAADFCVEFDFEQDLSGRPRSVTRFRLNSKVFVTDPVSGLDFTVIAIGKRIDGDLPFSAFGFSSLSDAKDKHMIGECANIVQHPQGRFKEVVLRENRLVHRSQNVLHYLADTEPGSSGAPVYNSEWRLIALHHWGGPWIDRSRPVVKRKINEGIRISSIVRHLRSRLNGLQPSSRKRIGDMLELGNDAGIIDSLPSKIVKPDNRSSNVGSQAVVVDSTGKATWSFPVELSFSIPALSGSFEAGTPSNSKGGHAQGRETLESDHKKSSDLESYLDRDGYRSDFLSGFEIPMPLLGESLKDDVAPVLNPVEGQLPYELKYRHFSVVLHRRRKIALVTACNIDGAQSKSDRSSSQAVHELDATDSILRKSLKGRGQRLDDWKDDPRVLRESYSGGEIYSDQRVADFPDPGLAEPGLSRRNKRMMRTGNLVCHIDPAWGDVETASQAEADTLHWTNVAPQVGFFGRERSDGEMSESGGGKLWRAAESYVLRNAIVHQKHMTSFAGPIFDANDRAYRGMLIPSRYFKLICWVERGALRSLAFIVDQSKVLDLWPKAMFSPSFTAPSGEASMDVDELDRVEDFLSSVKEVESLTLLDFGARVRDSDVRSGRELARVDLPKQWPLGPPKVNGLGVPPRNLLEKPCGLQDDLKKIGGVGVGLERRLRQLGIFHFWQIASWTPENVKYVDDTLGGNRRAKRQRWVDQAKALLQ